jgi:Zn-dependent protease
MPTTLQNSLTMFGLALVPALFGIICHEVAHGWMADKLGDPTAKRLGRLTLNPIRHIDPVGLGVFVVTVLLMPFAIGWAKPVPVQSRYFRRPREGMVFVALAGPAANLLVALLCAVILKLTLNLENSGLIPAAFPMDFIQRSAALGIGINCALAWFNLMPIPPLDGSHVVSGLLPASLADRFQSLARYGMLIIMLLLATGGFGRVLVPLIRQTRSFIITLTGI